VAVCVGVWCYGVYVSRLYYVTSCSLGTACCRPGNWLAASQRIPWLCLGLLLWILCHSDLLRHAAPAIALKGRESSSSAARGGGGASGPSTSALEVLGDKTSSGMKETMEIFGTKMENIEQREVMGNMAMIEAVSSTVLSASGAINMSVGLPVMPKLIEKVQFLLASGVTNHMACHVELIVSHR
jgi:hypothetical protein